MPPSEIFSSARIEAGELPLVQDCVLGLPRWEDRLRRLPLFRQQQERL